MNSTTKAILFVVAAVIYALWPIDLVPDFIPIAGQLDDFLALLYGGKKAWECLKNQKTIVMTDTKEAKAS
jgi:uncharacterized membrane protein YkvA (DUF1232 family)